MINPFDIGAAAFDPLKQTVTVTQYRDGAPTVTNVEAVLIIGNGLSSAAGAMIHAETADRYSLVIDYSDWVSDYAPMFGDSVDVGGKVGTITMKQVTAGAHEYTIRCARNMRGNIPQ